MESINQSSMIPTGSKRTRRMRSVQSNLGSNKKKAADKKASYQDSGNGAAIFLVKTYDMISTCDDNLAAWSDDGETFVVKDPDTFAAKVIPEYFDHSKFSSFSRQLNFYGFKKVPMKAVRTSEYDKESSKHVRFYNEKFKRGRKDLLSQIHRSTRNSNNVNNQSQEIKTLKDRVSTLETQLYKMQEAFMSLEAQMRQMINTDSFGNEVQQTYNQIPTGSNNSGTSTYASKSANESSSYQYGQSDGYSQYQQNQSGKEARTNGGSGGDVATLAPHPNVKKLDPKLLPPPPDATQLRAASLLRGFSSEFNSESFSPFEAKLFENIMSNPPGTQSNPDVKMHASEQSNIKSMEGLNISRQQTCSEVLPPVDTDVGSTAGV